ncbi:MAG: hypothetical protein KatS3mg011_0747 [Acidimicrobiia bacterium]|jgi:hypothetical protein|nr:MAG: hypothetical protein KatS3mg011_0747 [Acidimicrobiia bacterium]
MPEAPVLIAALVIATIWGIYLFPSVFGSRRDAPLSSTEEFDRWTHLMADVQRRGYSKPRVTARNVVRARRRRTLAVLIGLAVITLVLAYVRGSVGWLLANLLVDALIAWYVGMLLQLKQREAARAAAVHAAERRPEADTPVRIVAGR